MSKRRKSGLLLILIVQFIQYSHGLVLGPSSGIEKCRDICSEGLTGLSLPKVYNTDEVCQRGCRLFNIVDATDNDINDTLSECQKSCMQAYYGKEDRNVCNDGCKQTAIRKQSEENSVVYIEDSEEMILFPQNIEHGVVEDDFDVLSASVSKYKIPETHVRTMPLEENFDYGVPSVTFHTAQPKGDWLDCAARGSGIPRWVLVSVILSAMMVALWLSFTTEKVEAEKTEESLDNDLPPKYVIESEKV